MELRKKFFHAGRISQIGVEYMLAELGGHLGQEDPLLMF